MAVCPRCTTDNLAGSRFCMNCGTGLMLGCGVCGGALPAGARFCPSCGAPAAESSVDVGESLKLVTILFADVVGSTAQAEHLPPDEVRSLMAEFFETMIQEIQAEGGTVERLIGDAIMADFGVPVAREDDPVRAVRAARRMLRGLASFNANRDEQLKIRVRIGINTGQVSTGGSLGERLMVMGDAVNVAARLQQAAQPGTVVIGERTAALVKHAFHLRQIEPIEAKGKTKPVDAFVVEADVENPNLITVAMPLTGRSNELTRLDDALRTAARENAPHVVTIIGEAGSGKTRLLKEFIEPLPSSATVLIGRCPASEGGLTLWPFRDMLRSQAQLSNDDPPQVAFDKLTALAATAGEHSTKDQRRIAEGLASTIGLESAFSALEDVDPREIQRRMFSAWAAFLSSIAQKARVVIAVEDLHWADAATRELLAFVSTNVEGPLLIVCAARPEFLADQPRWLAGLPNYTSITLQALSPQDCGMLIDQLLHPQEVPQSLRQDIIERAGGNPLFLHEMCLRLLDAGFDPGAAGTSDIEVPDSIHALIQARLDLLPAEQRVLLQKASVIGRSFWESAISEITGATMLRESLEHLARRQLIHPAPSTLADENEYRFEHVLIRDVAYDSLPRRVKGETHAAVGEWLQLRSGKRAQEFAEVLTTHFRTAFEALGDDRYRTRARGYALVATTNASRRFAVEQAETYAEQAVALSLPGREKVEALEAIGDLYSLTHRSQRAYDAYREALNELERDAGASPSEVARLAAKSVITPTRWWGTMDALPTAAELEELLTCGFSANGDQDSAAGVMLLAGQAFGQNLDLSLGRDGVACGRAAIEMAERLDDPDLLSLSIDALAAALFPRGDWGEIHELTMRRVELVPRLRDIREVSDAYGMGAVTSLRKGLCRQGVSLAEAEVVAAGEVDAGSRLQGLVWRIVGNFILGEWDLALADQREVEKMKPRPPDMPGPMAMRAYTVTMFCHELRGNYEQASAYLDYYRTYLLEEQRRGFTPGGHPEAARMLAHRGDFAAATAFLSTDRSDVQTLHLEALCEVIRIGQSWKDAGKILGMARDEAEHQRLSGLRFFADRLDGAGAASTGDTERAMDLLTSSMDGFAELEAVWEAALSQLLLAEALQHSDPRRAIQEADAAGAVFHRLGSVAEEARAHGLRSSTSVLGS